MTFTEPHGETVLNEIADLLRAVIRPIPSPLCVKKIVLLIEINPAVVVRIGAVKSPQIQIVWPIVIVEHIHEHRDPELMSRLHKRLEPVRAAEGTLHAKYVGRIVAPTEIAGKLVDGHDLNGGDAELLQVSQPVGRGSEGP